MFPRPRRTDSRLNQIANAPIITIEIPRKGDVRELVTGCLFTNTGASGGPPAVSEFGSITTTKRYARSELTVTPLLTNSPPAFRPILHGVTAAKYRLYVALGDSTTEGIDDPYPGGARYRGWADRLAEHLATVNPGILYANFAIRGRKIGQIYDTQLQPALALKPDLVSVVGGVNDLLRRSVDLEYVADRMERMQIAFRESGATVLTMTLPDLSDSIGLARIVSDRVTSYNQLMREIAQRTGAVLVDTAADPLATHLSLWSKDRLHANAEGHKRIAAAAARALGVPNVAEDGELLPHSPPGALRSLPGDALWAWRHMRPWLTRRLRGTSSGDGVAPKRAVPAPVERQSEDHALNG
ncbi:MAG: SGNH/GDSL hydrolase family protein [Actinobacteria bacterium]|nr:SGNH/GDSL hydrolase family protein [Actinomycetota bacterium]